MEIHLENRCAGLLHCSNNHSQMAKIRTFINLSYLAVQQIFSQRPRPAANRSGTFPGIYIVKTKFLFASVAALVIATPAIAQEAPSEFKGGARVEARVGIDDVVLKAAGDSESKVGFAYGGEVGYDYATKSGFVIGAYAGIEGATTKDCAVTGTQSACIKAGRNITAGVRAGGVVAGGLLYAKGGYSNGRLNLTYKNTAAPATNFSDGGNADGWHLGAGYEFTISEHTYAKLEYVYTHYSVDDTSGLDFRLQRHQGVVGFGYRF